VRSAARQASHQRREASQPPALLLFYLFFAFCFFFSSDWRAIYVIPELGSVEFITDTLLKPNEPLQIRPICSYLSRKLRL
jgi:hypothetical protein